MDPVSALIDAARAEGAFVLRSHLSPPWAIRVDDQAPLCVLTTTVGTACLRTFEGWVRLQPGDVALVRGSAGSYVVADDPGTGAQVAIDAHQEPSVLRADAVPMEMLGVRSWGNSTTPHTVLLSGTYQARGEVSETLLNLLPPIVVVRRPASETVDPLMSLLVEEVAHDDLGQDRMLDRLLDLALIRTVRSWLAQTAGIHGWASATRDPLIGHALRLMHEQTAEPWTVDSLARAVGLSRAAFARRFRTLVGRPPLAYLTEWRLMRAADLLRTTDRTLDSIAAGIGYGSGFALSSAFRRERDESPSEYRFRVRSGGLGL